MIICCRDYLKSLLPPRHDHKVVTPLLEKGGEIFDFKYLNFLLLNKACPGTPSGGAGRSTPDGTVRGELVTFEIVSTI
jgi:hypothetical protein